jgi:hypothetical protein
MFQDPADADPADGFYVRRHMTTSERLARTSAIVFCALLSGCATTTVTLAPEPQAPVCDRAATALVLWAPQWRSDQKDVAAREEAAAAGITNFLATSACFARHELRRVADLGSAAATSQAAGASGHFNRVVTIGVRELGPIVKLLSSAALVEGGTEVVLQVSVRSVQSVDQVREFTVHWRNGGPGVVKGVASLSGDMQAALSSGLQPSATTR